MTINQANSLTISLDLPDSADGRMLIGALDAELRTVYPVEHMHGLHPGEEQDPKLSFLVARLDGQAVACGALRLLEPGVGEIKRMYVLPEFRGRGFSRKILTRLEELAAELGCAAVRLETGLHQVEALGLYRSAGYGEIPAYGEYVNSPVSVCFEKRLDQ